MLHYFDWRLRAANGLADSITLTRPPAGALLSCLSGVRVMLAGEKGSLTKLLRQVADQGEGLKQKIRKKPVKKKLEIISCFFFF